MSWSDLNKALQAGTSDDPFGKALKELADLTPEERKRFFVSYANLLNRWNKLRTLTKVEYDRTIDDYNNLTK